MKTIYRKRKWAVASAIVRIERFCPGPRLELFAREAREGGIVGVMRSGNSTSKPRQRITRSASTEIASERFSRRISLKKSLMAMLSTFLTGTAAASGIAWINSIGNLGGFFGPTAVGWIKDYTGSFAGGLYALAALALMSAMISALWLHIPRHVVPREIAGVATA